MIRDFGVLLAVGIVMLVIVGIVVPGSALGVREFTAADRRRAEGSVGRARRRQARQPAGEGGADHRRGRRRPVRRRRARRGATPRIESDPIKWINQDSHGRQGRRAARGRDRLLDHARDPRPGQQRLRPAGDRPDLGLHARRRGPRRGRVDVEPREHDGQDPDDPGSHADRAERDRHLRRLGGDARGHRQAARPLRGRGRQRPAVADCIVDPAAPTGSAELDCIRRGADQPAAGAASLEERAVLVESLGRRSAAADRRPRHPRRQHPARGTPARTGAGARRARRPRHGRHRPAREPVRQPRRAHLPRAQPRRPVPRAAHAQPRPRRARRSSRCSSRSASRRSRCGRSTSRSAR